MVDTVVGTVADRVVGKDPGRVAGKVPGMELGLVDPVDTDFAYHIDHSRGCHHTGFLGSIRLQHEDTHTVPSEGRRLGSWLA